MDINNILEGLSPEEAQHALTIIEELAKGNKGIYNKLYEEDFLEIPVSPEEFLDNPYYYQHVGKNLYPIWRKNFIDLYSNDYYHVIITGAIGIGKDFFVTLCLAYELYRIGCLRNPHKFFGRAINTDIVIALVSITKTQTKYILFEGLKNGIDGSPWFRENFPRDFKKNDIMEFNSPQANITGENMGKIRVIYGAPNNSTVIGANVITAAIDEANFMEVVEHSKKARGLNKEFNQAQMLYNNIYRRMQSRYLKQGKMPGKLFILSSRQYPDDFVEKKIQELRGVKGVFIKEYSLWEVNRSAYSDETFKVDCGDSRYPPKILEEGEAPRPEANIIEVPIDFRHAFEINPEEALRDLAGVASLSTATFIKQRDKLYKSVDVNLSNLFEVDSSTLLDEYWLNKEAIEKADKDLPRTIHLDLASSQDSAGMAMVHCSGYKNIDRLTEVTNEYGTPIMTKVQEVLPIFTVDLLLRIPPPVNGEINYAKIRQIIFELRDVYGFNIVLVSADQYQSKDTLQILQANGFETAYISVDRSLQPYYSLRTAIYEDRFRIPPNELFIDEIVHLEEDYKRRKIDHLSGRCFTGDTKIKLLNGKDVMLKDLVDEKEFWVYSCLPNGTIVPAKAHNCRITYYTTKMCEVVLDNGEIIHCTPDHKFMLRDGRYKEAQYLTDDDSLMQFEIFKVKCVRIYEIEKTPMYDIEVPIYSNFALSSGVFVHNSKDTCDAVAGAIHGLISLDILEAGIQYVSPQKKQAEEIEALYGRNTSIDEEEQFEEEVFNATFKSTEDFLIRRDDYETI